MLSTMNVLYFFKTSRLQTQTSNTFINKVYSSHLYCYKSNKKSRNQVASDMHSARPLHIQVKYTHLKSFSILVKACSNAFKGLVGCYIHQTNTKPLHKQLILPELSLKGY